ncbi:hypothetical protein MtrunA17_Chr4g0030751 [Medicago truncatula]|uniref:Uncharacterized protein n=1 Tax=Medicago truncatula TaxID=3880 RepID=A0A396I813_MEDTR|nr:hypothetical protein MtrunA17_Chr4g0030751 [Medicago truncatula]
MRHICRDQKQQIFFAGTKTKTRHICRDQNHILAKKLCTQHSISMTNIGTHRRLLTLGAVKPGRSSTSISPTSFKIIPVLWSTTLKSKH